MSTWKKKYAQSPQFLAVDGLRLNLKIRELQNGHGANHHLTPEECQLLATFMRHPNQIHRIPGNLEIIVFPSREKIAIQVCWAEPLAR